MEVRIYIVFLVAITLAISSMDLQCIGRYPCSDSFFSKHGYSFLWDDIYEYFQCLFCSLSTTFKMSALTHMTINYFIHQVFFIPHTLWGICYTSKFFTIMSVSLNCCNCHKCHNHFFEVSKVAYFHYYSVNCHCRGSPYITTKCRNL